MDFEEKIVKFYSYFAQNYDEVVLKDRDYIAFEKIPLWITKIFQEAKCRILDLGCGTGLSSLKFFAQGYEVSGIDITPEMIQKAQKHPFSHLFCQSLEDSLPFQDKEFDAAIMLGVLEFIQRPHLLFSEIHRILKDFGLFALTVPLKLSPDQEQKLEIISYNFDEIEFLFQDAGFQITYHEDFQGFVSQDISVRYRGYLLKKK
jgi:SAM-dependent methyltransferase